MRFRNKCLKAQLLFMLLCLSSFVFAQTKSEDKKLLLGKWVLENNSFNEANNMSSANLDRSDIDVYSEIEIKQDAIVLTCNGNSKEGEYTVDEGYLIFDFLYKEKANLHTVAKNDSIFDFASMPFVFSWKITDDKLYMQQDVRDLSDKSKVVIVSLVYVRK